MDFRQYERLGRYTAVTVRDGEGDLRLLHVNRDLAELLGYPRRQLVGSSTFALGSNHNLERRMRIDVALELSSAHRGQAGVVTRDGVLPCGYLYRRQGELHVAVVEPLRESNEWLTQTEAAEYVHLSDRTIRRAGLDGELLVGGVPHAPRYRRSWLDAWLLRRHVPIVPLLMLTLVLLVVALAVVGDVIEP